MENKIMKPPQKAFDSSYFLGNKEKANNKEKKYFLLIIYDISDNKRRNQMVKVLEGYGVRVQKSAFEAIIRPNKYEKMLMEIGTIPEITDSVRVYKIQKTSSVDVFGMPFNLEDEETVII